MDITQGMFWLFLAVVSVGAFTFIAVAVWSGARLQERQEYYRFEFRKRLVDAGKMDADALAKLARFEHDLGQQQGRQKMLAAAFIIAGAGVGTCAALLVVGGAVWMLGLIPLCVGLSMLGYAFVVPAGPKPGAPPVGWPVEPGGRD